MAGEDKLWTLQTQVKDHLAAGDWFTANSIELLTEDEGAIDYIVDRMVKTKTAMTAIVMCHQATSFRQSVPGPALDDVQVIVSIFNNPKINSDGPKMLTFVGAVMSRGHLYRPAIAAAPLEMGTPPFKRVAFPGLVNYEVLFRTRINMVNDNV